MSFALSAGVTGLQAHQKMLDIAGNNLANVNTTAFKASRITFSELLCETIKKASQPTATSGGTNPQQMGSGVGVAGITPNMAQGNIVNTGNPLDMAMEGEGYFVLKGSEGDIFTRAGSFGVDADGSLVDPGTGYLVQRIGSTGEADGFQQSGVSNIHIPYDVTLPASATSAIMVQGNLSSDASSAPQTQVLASNINYTANSGTAATASTEIDQLDQFSGSFGVVDPDGKLYVTGYEPDGTPVTDAIGLDVDASTTLGDVLTYIDTQLGASNVTASIGNGRIVVTDDTSGYSQTDITLSYTGSSDGDDSLTVPAYFELTTVGSDEIKDISITTYDSLGTKHVLSGAFVRTDTANTWDMVLTSITGNISQITMDNRRIKDIEFDSSNGAYAGLGGGTPDTPTFVITFQNLAAQTFTIDMGTVSGFDGLTQLAGTSTAVARSQDGYESGNLSTISVDQEGVLIGSFTNGIKRDIATLQIALFQNATALESAGNGYYSSSANSGGAITTQAMTAGSGSVHGGALEKSNSDVASEFVSMIQAQNGFQANARTIRVANDILRELTNLIR